MWLRMQAAYDLSRAEKKVKKSDVQRLWKPKALPKTRVA
jgi:plasmid maintenance system antidote protein VapI